MSESETDKPPSKIPIGKSTFRVTDRRYKLAVSLGSTFTIRKQQLGRSFAHSWLPMPIDV